MDLWHVDFDANGPSHGVYHRKDIDGDDDHPAPSSERPVDGFAGVEPADEEHDDSKADTAIDDAATTAPFIRVDEAGNGDAEDHEC